ncbi:MFS transporter [Streptomyces sp. JW3]|uniref:MFS transporter n=1 Tax=Streptomyces sp. JW3 TaxID=3456955 RepID=UPI003FA4BA8A
MAKPHPNVVHDVGGSFGHPTTAQGTPGEDISVLDGADPKSGPPGVVREPVGKDYITLVTLGVFGAYISLVTPVAISLALKIEQLAPDSPQYLGYITGIGAMAALIATPVFGVFSDRTRSRLGRRRPYMIGGLVGGVVALVLLATAPNLIVLGAAWVLTQLSWGAGVLSALTYSQADRLPEEQRGKVSGLIGFVQNLAPVIGAGIASVFIGHDLLVFLVPGAIGLIAVLLFVIFIKEDEQPAPVGTEGLDFSGVARSMVFNPRQYPAFAWNCLGRVTFNLGLSFATTFTTFFFAARMDKTVSEIGALVVVLSMGGIVAGSVGALGAGWLSDKLQRRRIFVLGSAFLFSLGVAVMAFGSGVPVLVAGSLITTLGTGAFMSVDQAIVFDVLPERDSDAGRYIGINNYATLLPQAAGPALASALLVIGAPADGENYTLLFMVAAVCTLIGGTIIFTRVRDAQ